MSSALPMPDDAIATQRDAFTERFLQSLLGAFNIFAIYIGDRLGFYRALAEGGPSTAAELAARTNTHERYVRERVSESRVTLCHEEHADERRQNRDHSSCEERADHEIILKNFKHKSVRETNGADALRVCRTDVP